MMIFRQFIAPFSLGFVAGFVVARNWDAIRDAVTPVAQRIGRRGREAVDRARERFWEQRERFEDLVAEIREKQGAGAEVVN